jgi:3-oxoadipate enol-lactonase
VTTPREARYLDVPGARVAYEEQGDGPAVVFSHAALGDRRMWDPQVHPFSERFRVVRYDARGFGQTTSEGSPFTRHEDLLRLLDEIGIERPHLVGGSLGGRVSIDFALAHPDRVASLVLVGSALQGYEFSDPRVLASWDEEDAASEAGDLERLVDNEMRTWLAGFDRPLDDVDAAVRALVRTMLLDSYRLPPPGDELRLKPQAIERLGEISVPTLVIVGDRDAPDIQAIADLLAAGIRGARSMVLSGTAHAPNLERPDEFNEIVLDFLLSLDRTGDHPE